MIGLVRISVVCVAASALTVWGQSTGAAKAAPCPVRADRVSNATQRYLRAMGDRAVKPGQERSRNTGTLQAGSGPVETMQWTWEFPGKLRVDRQSRKDVIVFDTAESKTLALAETEDEILEALSADTADAFFDRMQSGVHPRLLGLHFKAAGPPGFGREVDIFEVAAPVAARSQKGASVKHFHFDSATGLLARVVYEKRVSGRAVAVRTEYSGYEEQSGQQIARRVTRYHGNQKVLEITVQASVWEAGVKDGFFSTAK